MKHEEVEGLAMLNEATKKAVVTEMAPAQLATHLKLNADRYNTYAVELAGTLLRQLEVAKPTRMWVDHVGAR